MTVHSPILPPNVSYLRPAPDEQLGQHLLDIIARRQLSSLFQPIVDMKTGQIIAYEGLIRGPSDSPLHSPLNLFKAARSNNLTREVEYLCRRAVLERFAELKLPGKLFLNVSPESLVLKQDGSRGGETLGYIHQIGINPANVIIELTENQPTYDYELMREAVLHYRKMGFQIAIDDLGEGFSSLRLWSELRPEYVKVDMHFIQGINADPVKLQFVRSIQEIADKSNTLVIAEGIEKQAELLVLRDLGVAYPFFVFRSADQALTGGITLSNVRRGVAQMGSIGYWCGRPYARQGHTLSAVRAVCDFAFRSLGLHRVEAACIPDNGPSRRLLGQAGFAEEGYARAYLKINGAWRDHVLFGLVSPIGGTDRPDQGVSV